MEGKAVWAITGAVRLGTARERHLLHSRVVDLGVQMRVTPVVIGFALIDVSNDVGVTTSFMQEVVDTTRHKVICVVNKMDLVWKRHRPADQDIRR